MSEEELVIHIVCDEGPLQESAFKAEQLLTKIDIKAGQTQAQLEQIAQNAAMVEQQVALQYTNMRAMIGAAFGIMRNLMVLFGASMTIVEQALFAAMETVLTSILTMQQAIAVGTGPLGVALIGIQAALSISASVMMVRAQMEARVEFADISRRITAGANLLEIASRTL